MTQLDRLEALAEKARGTLEEPWTDEDAAFLLITLRTLPDLIRVARAAAAHEFWHNTDGSAAEGPVFNETALELRAALAPLYREVEGTKESPPLPGALQCKQCGHWYTGPTPTDPFCSLRCREVEG